LSFIENSDVYDFSSEALYDFYLCADRCIAFFMIFYEQGKVMWCCAKIPVQGCFKNL
jgi:hypothetical protein